MNTQKNTPKETCTKPRITLFDLDSTLLPIDSDHAWGEFTIALGWVDALEFKSRNDDFYAQYRSQTLDIAEYIRFTTTAMRQQGTIKSIAAHALFMHDVIDLAIQKPAIELVQKHLRDDAAVVIVTATNEFVTRPIATAFGVHELIAVELERDPATQEWTGEIRGTPSFREGKITRVAEWLHARGLDWDGVHITFYSDSMNDLPLLEKAQTPIATNPDPKLRALAKERGWQVLDLFG